MRLDDYRESENVEQQQAGGGSGGGFGGGGLGLLFGLVGSRFGLGGIVVLVIGMMLFGMNPLSLLGGGQPAQQQVRTTGQTPAQVCAADPAHRFSCRVLASTEDTWGAIFQASGQRYTPTTLSFYSQNGVSGCGAAQSAMGPFYCPTDKKVYLDTSFFHELTNRFHAGGDFAQAYVIAHEVGHHVQDLTGIADKVRQGQQSGDEAHANALQVRMELQADCYAGVWAQHNRDRLDPGDVEEGLRAANAIGDDTLQKSAGRVPVPDSFTHGTSAERVAWLRRGIDSGDVAQCDTFSGSIDR
ncbi:KPN_02809 family neutral zinc metallopeptidase [Sphingomonas nostoxanthinifaciens]|uniref:KPN_02809 family neutral zinc metallopeptidase n=1 Tax=Sphingomonas nostoxanthinifaciens TaxID=2872652 RepID=UPI001CC1FB54|nr:neutral zinc metallopeptidase [Sphingomonas nostoxanthinifaciens]UAK25431.1 neutral zinc metallopeptidase [Sphingomonas nostoxanthinifaciens]